MLLNHTSSAVNHTTISLAQHSTISGSYNDISVAKHCDIKGSYNTIRVASHCHVYGSFNRIELAEHCYLHGPNNVVKSGKHVQAADVQTSLPSGRFSTVNNGPAGSAQMASIGSHIRRVSASFFSQGQGSVAIVNGVAIHPLAADATAAAAAAASSSSAALPVPREVPAPTGRRQPKRKAATTGKAKRRAAIAAVVESEESFSQLFERERVSQPVAAPPSTVSDPANDDDSSDVEILSIQKKPRASQSYIEMQGELWSRAVAAAASKPAAAAAAASAAAQPSAAAVVSQSAAASVQPESIIDEKNAFALMIPNHLRDNAATDSTDDEKLCCICLSNIKCVLLNTCGHVATCIACTKAIQTKPSPVHCPLCDHAILSAFAFFH
jgi:ureidoglycolate hydrolase